MRNVDDARALLDAGADKVSVNTAAVHRPELLGELSAEFGSQCTVLAIDAAWRRGLFEVLVRSGTEGTGREAHDWAREAAERGAGEILLTSWDRDGTRAGYDMKLLASVRSAVSVPLIASGGAARPEDLQRALEAGADAVLAASIFHDTEFTVRNVKEVLIRAGLEVRP